MQVFERTRPFAALALRLALATAFLSAVADRFGLWGPPGTANVAWGNFESFLAYTAALNPWAPAAAIPALGWVATIAEVVLAMMLIFGLWIRVAATLSAALLLAFGISMAVFVGPEAPLSFSVFTAAAGAWILATLPSGDRLLPVRRTIADG